ncbi:MAG: stage IV sporulation protein A, partial [Oscillospiraceae bacterium]|nr:stage IV sporulation protein A [Oscillospiraceae bacterium]
MSANSMYEDIAKRTDGNIYIGVVGPVRTGKSTFIKRFMDTLVIPNIENEYARERARDELPQSASGRTIMTSEPKFVPEEAVTVPLGSAEVRVRLIDCVGYMVPGAQGQFEDGVERMVTTPWSDTEVTLSDAAEIGTKKVIEEHATIGIVITTDGSITDIPRDSYLNAETRVITEMRERGKPFLVIVNSRDPQGAAALALKSELETKYNVSAVTANCQTLTENEITELLQTVLYEFPIAEFGVFLPKWIDVM